MTWGPVASPAARWTALTVCVMPVHIEILLHADTYAAPCRPALWARQLLQPVVISIIWAATRPAGATAHA
jgi:uncharacterized membrane protein